MDDEREELENEITELHNTCTHYEEENARLRAENLRWQDSHTSLKLDYQNVEAERDHLRKQRNVPECECVIKNREPYEPMREWLKRIMCMHHWMQTDYYQQKLFQEKSDEEWKERWKEWEERWKEWKERWKEER